MTTIEKYNQTKTAYLSSLKIDSRSQATYDKYNLVLGYFGDFLKNSNLAKSLEQEIPPLLVLEWKQHLANHDIKRNTIRHYLVVLRAFFKWAIIHKMYTEQPVAREDIPKSKKVELDLLTEEEIERIMSGELPSGINKATAIRNRAIVMLLIYSGVRVSELINLKDSDIDFENGSIYVQSGKGDKSRATTFPPQARDFVKEYLESRQRGKFEPKNAYFFGYNDSNGVWCKFTRQNITQLVKTYVKHLIGRNDIGAHDLRHAYASRLLTNGAPLESIQVVLGHSNYSTTVIYANHLKPSRIASDLNSLFAKAN